MTKAIGGLELQMFLNDEVPNESMFWKKKKVENGTEEVDEGRRDALKKGIALGVGGYLAAKGFGLDNEAEAKINAIKKGSLYDDYPPGIAMAPNGVRKAFDPLPNKSNVEWYLNGQGKSGEHMVVTNFHRLTEPAIYFVEALKGVRVNMTDDELRRENPALAEFRTGIMRFMSKWKRKNNEDSQRIEMPFINSIFLGAYTPSEAYGLAQEFYAGSLTRKAQMISEIMDEFDKMSGADNKVESLRNPYFKILAASWSAMWFSNHFWLLAKKDGDENDKISLFINKNLEIPLRKFTGRLRAEKGGPYYFNKTI